MLRIITEPWSARTELRRIRERFDDPEIREKESLVREIVDQVRLTGDRSLVDYTEKFYQQSLNLQQLKVSGSELDAAYQQVSQDLLNAIAVACEKMEAFHRQRLPKAWVQFPEDGTVRGKRYQPVNSVGIVVPDGKRAYLSLLLQQAIPATIAPVEMIAGIGDFYTNLAKKLVSDHVKIDYLSITSDLVIIADNQANPRQLALDLLAQAEQYSLAAAILLTTDKALALIVQEEVQKQLQVHPQRLLTEKAIAHYGLIVVVESLEKAIELSNLFAPTHLSLMIEQSGTILLGSTTPKAVADYLGCPVGVETFLDSATLIEYPADSFASIAHNLQILAQAEGFTATDAGIESRGQDKN